MLVDGQNFIGSSYVRACLLFCSVLFCYWRYIRSCCFGGCPFELHWQARQDGLGYSMLRKRRWSSIASIFIWSPISQIPICSKRLYGVLEWVLTWGFSATPAIVLIAFVQLQIVFNVNHFISSVVRLRHAPADSHRQCDTYVNLMCTVHATLY